jgi:hypothetical protein
MYRSTTSPIPPVGGHYEEIEMGSRRHRSELIRDLAEQLEELQARLEQLEAESSDDNEDDALDDDLDLGG